MVFAYFSEFLTRADRGRHLSWLLMAWVVGGVFTALVAWLVIPSDGEFTRPLLSSPGTMESCLRVGG